jgi:serine/threonine protein kinase
MAPEVVLRHPYSEKADVYSFGIMLWQMARDKVPFKGFSKEEFIDQVVHQGERPKLDRSWPVGFTNLLKACWADEAERRPSFGQVVAELNRLWAVENKTSTGGNNPSGGDSNISNSWF